MVTTQLWDPKCSNSILGVLAQWLNQAELGVQLERWNWTLRTAKRHLYLLILPPWARSQFRTGNCLSKYLLCIYPVGQGPVALSYGKYKDEQTQLLAWCYLKCNGRDKVGIQRITLGRICDVGRNLPIQERYSRSTEEEQDRRERKSERLIEHFIGAWACGSVE
jgi:hypothetical protein